MSRKKKKRIKIDILWFSTLSDLFINISAGWFGAIFVVPNFTGIEFPFNLMILTMDFLFAIFCLVLAFKFRKFIKKK